MDSSAAVAPARTARANLLEEEEKGRESRVTRWRTSGSNCGERRQRESERALRSKGRGGWVCAGVEGGVAETTSDGLSVALVTPSRG